MHGDNEPRLQRHSIVIVNQDSKHISLLWIDDVGYLTSSSMINEKYATHIVSKQKG